MRKRRSSSSTAWLRLSCETCWPAEAFSARASPTELRRRRSSGTSSPAVMASPRKNGTNGDGPDSTVTSSSADKQRPCRPQVRESGHLLSTARPSGPGAGPTRPKISRRGLPEWSTIPGTLALVLLSGRVEGSMWGRLKTLVLAAVVGAAALVPLFGDPRSTPVTHPLWARMLLRSLDMTDAVRTSTQASQVFATLAWRDSLSYPADRYLRSGGRERPRGGRPGGPRPPRPGPAEVSYALAVAQPGDYQLRARLSGQPGTAGDRRGPADGGRGRRSSRSRCSRPPRRAGCSPARRTSTRAPTRPSSSCPPAARSARWRSHLPA